MSALVLALLAAGAAACVDPDTMLKVDSAAIRIDGPAALRVLDALNHTGEPTAFRGETLIIRAVPEGGVVMFSIVRDGCATGEMVTIPLAALRAVLAKAYPKQKTEWRGM